MALPIAGALRKVDNGFQIGAILNYVELFADNFQTTMMGAPCQIFTIEGMAVTACSPSVVEGS